MSEDWASNAADEFRCRPGLSFGGPYPTRDGGTVEPVDDGYELGEYYNDVKGPAIERIGVDVQSLKGK